MKRWVIALAGLWWASAGPAHAECSKLHNFQSTTIQGQKVNLCEHQTHPILVVNTASHCGFSPQLEKLASLHKKYRDKGLVVIGFPSNDFKQELDTNKEIGDYCHQKYGVEFPMALKSSVVGPHANPLYKNLSAVTHEPPMWNFYKYLILPGGQEVVAFGSDVDPESPQILSRIKPYLK